LNTEEPLRADLRFTTAHGRKDVQAHSAPLRGKKRGPIVVLTMLTDVSAHKRLEGELQRARSSEESLRRSVEEVSGVPAEIGEALQRMGGEG